MRHKHGRGDDTESKISFEDAESHDGFLVISALLYGQQVTSAYDRSKRMKRVRAEISHQNSDC